MRWNPGGTSDDVEDRRGDSGGCVRLGLGGILILGVLSLLFKTNFFSLLRGGGGTASVDQPGMTQSRPVDDPKEQKEVQFVSFVLDDAQNTWTQILPKYGAEYRHAKLVLFRDAIQSGCGYAQSATGPFYCPADEKVYIDLSFYDELKRRFGAPGEFAQAYVLAHEVGHHVQKIIGVESKVRQLQSGNPGAANRLSVAMELQADCFAGVWAHSTQQRGLLDPGDVESALKAAAAVGDDHIQQMTRGRVQPETFTHGSSQQRMDWFNKGLDSGSIAACNTFSQQ